MPNANVSPTGLPGEIVPRGAEDVFVALGELGRTEDVRLSPGGRRLAIACYSSERIALADVEIARGQAGAEIQITGMKSFASPVLREPHGLDFLDDRTLVVGNRGGGISLVQLPRLGASGDLTQIDEFRLLPGLDAPGSVAVHRLEDGTAEVYACHNWASAVTRYTINTHGVIRGGEVVARRWLDLPDGVAVSGDGRWVAVSNHNTHDVFVYERAAMGEEVDPSAILRGVGFPHGLRFGADARSLLVADAGAPYVDVFARRGDSWGASSYAAKAIRVMDDATFTLGRYNAREGGPKGIDVDPGTNVLMVTSERTPLRFFDLEVSLEASDVRPPAELLRHELLRLERGVRLQAAATEAREQLDEVTATKAWRLTRPLRRARAAFWPLAQKRS